MRKIPKYKRRKFRRFNPDFLFSPAQIASMVAFNGKHGEQLLKKWELERRHALRDSRLLSVAVAKSAKVKGPVFHLEAAKYGKDGRRTNPRGSKNSSSFKKWKRAPLNKSLTRGQRSRLNKAAWKACSGR